MEHDLFGKPNSSRYAKSGLGQAKASERKRDRDLSRNKANTNSCTVMMMRGRERREQRKGKEGIVAPDSSKHVRSSFRSFVLQWLCVCFMEMMTLKKPF